MNIQMSMREKCALMVFTLFCLEQRPRAEAGEEEEIKKSIFNQPMERPQEAGSRCLVSS
jgi:hypothetical protein